MERYTKETEELMLSYYKTLDEKGRRHYAAQESQKLGHGGRKYINQLLNISKKTIRKGLKELNSESLMSEIPLGKQRRKGGGRKKRVLQNQT